MKRSSFLKLLIVAVTAPSVLANASPEKDKVPPSVNASLGDPNLDSDILRFYVREGRNFGVGDKIVSDMGYEAVIVNMFVRGMEDIKIDAMPKIMRTYHYKDINKFKIVHK